MRALLMLALMVIASCDDSAQETAKNTTPDSAQETAKNTAPDSAQGTAQDSASNAESVTLPPVVKTFVDANPDLNLKITEINAADDWDQGKRWRAKTEGDESLIIFEKDGSVESVRRQDLSFIWDRQGRK